MQSSTADSWNRIRDKTFVEKVLCIPECGCEKATFASIVSGEVVAVGYRRVVFGDHGPYIELERGKCRVGTFQA